MEIVRRLVLRSRLHRLLLNATEQEPTVEQVRALFMDTGFEPPADFDKLLISYIQLKRRDAKGNVQPGEVAFRLCV